MLYGSAESGVKRIVAFEFIHTIFPDTGGEIENAARTEAVSIISENRTPIGSATLNEVSFICGWVREANGGSVTVWNVDVKAAKPTVDVTVVLSTNASGAGELPMPARVSVNVVLYPSNCFGVNVITVLLFDHAIPPSTAGEMENADLTFAVSIGFRNVIEIIFDRLTDTSFASGCVLETGFLELEITSLTVSSG